MASSGSTTLPNAESVVPTSWSSFKDLLYLYAVEYEQSTQSFFGVDGTLFRVQITLTANHYNWMHRCEGTASTLVAATIIALADASSVMAKHLPQYEYVQTTATERVKASISTATDVMVGVLAGAKNAFGNTSYPTDHLLTEPKPLTHISQLFPSDHATQKPINDDAVSWLYRMQDKKVLSELKFVDYVDQTGQFACDASVIHSDSNILITASSAGSNKKRAKDFAATEMRAKVGRME